MKLTKLLFAFMLFGAIFTSCGDDDVDCTEAGLTEAIEAETEALSDALSAYIVDPSTANCEDLVSAYQDFIDQAKELQDCADEAGEGEEYMQSIAEAEASLADLEC
jgi:hypothetical protein